MSARPIPGLSVRASDVDPTRRGASEPGGIALSGPTTLWEPCRVETLCLATGTPDPHWYDDTLESGELAPQTFGAVGYGFSGAEIPIGAAPTLRRSRDEGLTLSAELRRCQLVDQVSEASGASASCNVAPLSLELVPGSRVEEWMQGIGLDRLPLLGVLYHAFYFSPLRPGTAIGPMVVSTADAVSSVRVAEPLSGPRVRTLPGTGGLEGQIDSQDRVDIARAEPTTFVVTPYVYSARLVRVGVRVA